MDPSANVLQIARQLDKQEKELEQRKRDLKTKHSYMKSQRKKLNNKIPCMPTLEHGFMDIDLICQEIDLLSLEKDLHEKNNRGDTEQLDVDLATQMTTCAKVTDCIYGLITYILDQAHQQTQLDVYRSRLDHHSSEEELLDQDSLEQEI
jgi:hypothetical protein